MLVRFLREQVVYVDGITPKVFKKGEEVELPAPLAESLLRGGIVEKVELQKEKKVVQPKEKKVVEPEEK